VLFGGDWLRIEAFLEELTGRLCLAIANLCIALREAFDEPTKHRFLLRCDQKVHVVRHQTKGVQGCSAFIQLSSKEGEQSVVVAWIAEQPSSIVASQDDMVRYACEHSASTSWHARLSGGCRARCADLGSSG
jgi:hypothetical protein